MAERYGDAADTYGASDAYAAGSSEVPDLEPGDRGYVKERVENASVAELVSTVAKDLSTLVRQELELAKLEAKRDAKEAGAAAGMFVGAAIAALLMLVFLSLALTWGLDNFMGVGWAALIVGLLWAAAAAVLAVVGRGRLKKAAPPLEKTVETVKEDVEWAKTRNR